MKRLLPLFLFPVLLLAGCASWFDDLFEAPDPAGVGPVAASASVTAPSIPVAEVSAFDGLVWDGSVLGTWSRIGPSRWSVRNATSGTALTVPETRRSDCCIYFQENDGSTMVADFQAMEVRFGGHTLAIGGVVY